MRSYILLPLLALLNMGVNAATIHNFAPYSTLPMNLRHLPRLPDSHNRRQVHNADFSSSTTAGPAAKGALTDPRSSSAVPGSSGSSAASGALGSRSPSAFDTTYSTAAASSSRRDLGALDRRVISVYTNSNPGESVAVENGDATLHARAETGSADANIDATKRDSQDHAAVRMVGYYFPFSTQISPPIFRKSVRLKMTDILPGVES